VGRKEADNNYVRSACRLLIFGFLFDLIFNLEDGRDTLLGDVSGLLPNCTVLQPWTFHIHRCENFISSTKPTNFFFFLLLLLLLLLFLSSSSGVPAFTCRHQAPQRTCIFPPVLLNFFPCFPCLWYVSLRVFLTLYLEQLLFCFLVENITSDSHIVHSSKPSMSSYSAFHSFIANCHFMF
jgi:hypothetical protein